MNPGMPPPSDRLFERLLPALYRLRDLPNRPLAALLEALELQYQLLSGNLEELYDNWFIATCRPWVIPYIGELLDVRWGETPKILPSWRSLVGNTIAYRRRQGTLAATAHATRDAAGWATLPVVYQNTLASTQALDALRPGLGGTADLRDLQALDDLPTPFNTLAHTARIRSGPRTVGEPEGQVIEGASFNLGLVGLHVWPWSIYPRTGEARKVGEGRYTFHPLGIDIPLFNLPRTLEDQSRLPGPLHLPIPLTRFRLRRLLAAAAARQPAGLAWLGFPPVLEVSLVPTGRCRASEPEAAPLMPREICVQDLGDWRPPPAPFQVAVDPELGRLTLAEGKAIRAMKVAYAYAAAGELGGGAYARNGACCWEKAEGFRALICRRRPARCPPGWHWYSSLGAAFCQWSQRRPHQATLLIADGSTYRWTRSRDFPARGWTLNQGQSLTLAAAEGVFPCLRGSPSFNSCNGDCRLELEGLLLADPLRLEGDFAFEARDCTFHPPLAGRWPVAGASPAVIASASDGKAPSLSFERCICGPLELAAEANLTAVGCLIDAGSGMAIGGPRLPPGAGNEVREKGPNASINQSTIFGCSRLQQLEARKSIFLGRVEVEVDLVGFVESSWVPLDSTTPRQYLCQPGLAASAAPDAKAKCREVERLLPTFRARSYGKPGYGQLAEDCAWEIRTGAAEGAEMGVFHDLFEPQRRAMLGRLLAEHLPWNMDVSLIEER